MASHSYQGEMTRCFLQVNAPQKGARREAEVAEIYNKDGFAVYKIVKEKKLMVFSVLWES